MVRTFAEPWVSVQHRGATVLGDDSYRLPTAHLAAACAGVASIGLTPPSCIARIAPCRNAVEVEVAQVQRRYGRTFKTLS